jgi:signal transduction histidine kinase
VKQARTMMERQLGQLVRLVDDLLDVNRIRLGKLELRKEQGELASIVQEAVESSRPLIEACGNELTVTLPPEPIYLDADLTRLAQVFSNLLNNAAKYSERGVQIWLSAERQGSEVVVAVKEIAMRAEEPVDFRADHPFVLLIRDNRTQSILFLGRLVNPKG